eukprot:CAMPEP_0201581560 /NCGR_PEP_ID=MMETSP0190_2-20130828/71039_1 /ASSEMBLY_ACC=CAM_ASM_000263 /TAXON_ID=37353 /ORGANISM="Rosalina sp." /LENGTH=96 /DNA_ID=CAMNT_0048019795 /DNA_START=21 /DNA_END=308 /DNA_ORIENTATION=+
MGACMSTVENTVDNLFPDDDDSSNSKEDSFNHHSPKVIPMVDYSEHPIFNTYQSKYFGDHRYGKILIMAYIKLEVVDNFDTPMDIINTIYAFWQAW